MDKTEINTILVNVATPIYQIEVDLGMPKTTLQKAIKGERELPKKWALKLIEAFPAVKKEIVIKDLNEHTNKIEPPKISGSQKSNFTLNTIPQEPKSKNPMPDPKKDRAGYAKWLRENS